MSRLQIGDLELKASHADFVIEYIKDSNAQRAAVVCGYAPEYGYTLLAREDVKTVLNMVRQRKYEQSIIDAEWLLNEMVDNHNIARATQNIAASNAALSMIGKHKMVDAFAKERIEMNVTGIEDRIAVLQRGRRRAAGLLNDDDVEEPEMNFI